MDMEMRQAAELYDALEAVDELHIVISRLKRLGLLTKEEEQVVVEDVNEITDTLRAKLPPEAE